MQFFSGERKTSFSGGIESLRGIAASYVFLCHGIGWILYAGSGDSTVVSRLVLFVLSKINALVTAFYQHNGETNPAVLCFIVLSGYCINRNGFRRGGVFNVKKFIIKRFFRIFPVFILSSIAGLFLFKCGVMLNEKLFMALTATQNVSFENFLVKISGISSFIPQLHTVSFQGNAPLSTVMVEIWLYILYACIANMSYQGYATARIMKYLLLFYGINFVYVNFSTNAIGWWHNGSLIAFSIYWWIGAFYSERSSYSLVRFSAILYTIFTVLLLFNITTMFAVVELRKVLFCMLFANLLLYIENKKVVLSKFLFLGKISYSMYAFHAPLTIYLIAAGYGFNIIVPAIIAVSIASYYLIEHPSCILGKKLAMKYG